MKQTVISSDYQSALTFECQNIAGFFSRQSVAILSRKSSLDAETIDKVRTRKSPLDAETIDKVRTRKSTLDADTIDKVRTRKSTLDAKTIDKVRIRKSTLDFLPWIPKLIFNRHGNLIYRNYQ